jgi:signal transduction histidine kinase
LRAGSVRTRVTAAITVVAVLAVGLFAVPLAVAAERLFREQIFDRLARDASRAAGEIPVEGIGGNVPVRLPQPLDKHTELGLYNRAGELVAGSGPTVDRAAGQVANHPVSQRHHVGSQLVVTVPVRVERGSTAVRAAAPYSEVTERAWVAWGLMAGLALAVLGIAAVLARYQAVRIAAPLEQLTHDANALGTGNFSIRARSTGLREADEASLALQATASRLEQLLERERTFSADASHQMRTPLTALRLGLETAVLTPGADLQDAIKQALRRVDRIDATLAELLALRREAASTGPVDVASVLEAGMRSRWAELADGAGRPIALRTEPDLPDAVGTAAVIDQVVDVLVSNAIEHGAGSITVTARAGGTGVAIDVADEGPGLTADAQQTAFTRRPPGTTSPGGGSGIGLSLARELAEAAGARLVLTRSGARPVFSLVLPAADDLPAQRDLPADVAGSAQQAADPQRDRHDRTSAPETSPAKPSDTSPDGTSSEVKA